MVPTHIIIALRALGALKIKHYDKAGNLHFDINYQLIETHFPQFLEDFVLYSLGMYDREVYETGYMAYIIQDDGSLAWKPTRKLHAIMAA